MTAPKIVSLNAVCWCPTCHLSRDVPEWAEQHTAETGHQTHRRRWTVETFEGEQ